MKQFILAIFLIIAITPQGNAFSSSNWGGITEGWGKYKDQKEVDSLNYTSDDNGINLYNNIEKGFNILELSNLTHELTSGGVGTKSTINSALKTKKIPECIDSDFTLDEMYQISENTQVFKIIQNRLTDNCGKNNVDTNLLQSIADTITDIYIQSEEKAKTKSKNIHAISQIGLYSDGILENSGFDLIQDLQDIDTIIFSNKIEYVGEQYQNGKSLLGALVDLSPDDDTEESKNNDTTLKAGNNSDSTDVNNSPKHSEDPENNTPENNDITETSNTYYCPVDQSGLAANQLQGLLVNIDASEDKTGNTSYTGLSNNSGDNNNQDGTDGYDPFGGPKADNSFSQGLQGGKYESVGDKWPCDNFFCITVDFISHDINLFTSGEDISIEYLIKRSNKHLRRYANVSLAPASMTSTNFELGLKDLNLSKSFNVGFQVTKKPIPILDVKEAGEIEENKTRFSSINLLKSYYKNKGLEYEKRNSLYNYFGTIEKQICIRNAAELNESAIQTCIREALAYKEKEEQKINILNDTIIQETQKNTLGNFGDQFRELERFSVSMNDYVENIYSTIHDMNIRIPKE